MKRLILRHPGLQTSSAELCSSKYGVRELSLEDDKTFHHGVDLAVPIGTEVIFDSKFRVSHVGEDSFCGKFVVGWLIDPDINVRPIRVFMCHLESTDCLPGLEMSAGEVIAATGNSGDYTTGAHLHLGVRLHTNGRHSRHDLSYEAAEKAGYEDPLNHFNFAINDFDNVVVVSPTVV